MKKTVTNAERLAGLLHEAYQLAPNYGYQTRKASAKPWKDVPEPNRSLMIAIAQEIIDTLLRGTDLERKHRIVDGGPHTINVLSTFGNLTKIVKALAVTKARRGKLSHGRCEDHA